MKWGFRKPSLKKRIAARTSVKRYVRHSLGLKAPRGWGWLTNPKKALYNRVYYRTTFSLGDIFKIGSKKRRRQVAVPSNSNAPRPTSSGCLLTSLGCGGFLVLSFFCCGIVGLMLPGDRPGGSIHNPPPIEQIRTVFPEPVQMEEATAAPEIEISPVVTPDPITADSESEDIGESGDPIPEPAAVKIVVDPNMRTWTSGNGKYTVEAKFESAAFGTVFLRNPAGKKIAVRLEELSEEDQEIIRRRARQ